MNTPKRKAKCIILNRLKLESGVKAATEAEMKEHFQKFGNIVNISAHKDRTTGFVEYTNTWEAERALEQPVHNIRGCEVRVCASDPSNLNKYVSFRVFLNFI